MNNKLNKVLSGVFSYGSPGLSTFRDKGPGSAVEQAATAGYSSLIITDTTICQRAVNEAAAKALGLELQQGWVVMTSDEEEGIEQCLLTLFPADLPEHIEPLFVEWSRTYPRVPLNPLAALPFGGENEPALLFTRIPLSVIEENEHSLLIFNSTLGGGSAIPYQDKLMELYNGFFVRCDGTYGIPIEQIAYLKRIRKRAMILPHFHIGSFSPEQRDAKLLQGLMKEQFLFPLPDNPKTRVDGISMEEFSRLYSLLDSGTEFFMNTPRIEVTSALIPGAKINADFHAVEYIPEKLKPTDEVRRELLSTLRGICIQRLLERYEEGEELEFAKEQLAEELKFLYLENFHAYLLGKTLLMLHQVLCELEKKCCILVKYFNHVPLITYLLGLSRFNPLENELGNHVSADIVRSLNFLCLDVSEEAYVAISKKLPELYPGQQIAETAEEQTAGELLQSYDTLEGRKLLANLNYEERENVKNSVVAFRHSTNGNHTILVAPDNMCLPSLRTEGADIPLVTSSFSYLSSALTMELSFSCRETLSRYERLEEAGCIPIITKRIERKLFKDFLPNIDRVMAAGIIELSPLMRKLIREEKPATRYELAALFSKHYLDGEYFVDFNYHLQLVDVILGMLAASLAHPEEYFSTIDLHDHDLYYPIEILERMVYEPATDGKVDEYTEALLIREGIETEHFLRESANSDRPLIQYARRKRTYPVLFT